MADPKSVREHAKNIRIFIQDMMETGHLFGGAIGNAMAIRDEADKLLALSAQSSPQPARSDGWLGIETAPRDGMEMLLWGPGQGFEVAFWHAAGVRPGFTHWQHLPPPPRDQQTEGEG